MSAGHTHALDGKATGVMVQVPHAVGEARESKDNRFMAVRGA
jgi:hypothetical protein